MKKRCLRLFTAGLACVFCFCAFLPGALAATGKTSLEEQQKLLQKSIQETQSKLDSMSKEKANQLEYLALLEQKLNLTQTKLATLQEQIDQLNEEIQDVSNQIVRKTGEIEEQQEKFDRNYQEFTQRLRALQMAGNVSSLEVLLTAKDFSSFLTRMEMVRGVSRQDKDSLSALMDEMKAINENKAQLEEQEKQLKQKKTSLEKTRSSLESSQIQFKKDEEACKAAVEEINKNSDVLAQKKKQDQAEEEKLAENLRKLASKNEVKPPNHSSGSGEESGSTTKPSENSGNSGDKPDSGGSNTVTGHFIIPIQGSYYISSPYGQRPRDFHKGVDLSGANFMGRPVLAADAGRVVVSMFGVSGSGYGGYGNVVVIDHGHGLMTLYAHNSERLVSAGDWVKQGQKIAEAGSTGISTGAHLHFEVRVDGDPVNPTKYVKL